MTADNDFDPIRIGHALLVLESELRDELASPEPSEAVRRLKLEIRSIVRLARAWAEQRGLPGRRIPEPPAPNAGAQECLHVLTDLRAALLETANATRRFGDEHD